MAPSSLEQLSNLGDLADRSADAEKVALIDLSRGSGEDSVREFSHGEVNRAADGVARALSARGFRRGERIAILAANSAEFLIAYYGTLRAGLVSVPVNFKFPAETIRYILADAGVRMVFTDPERRALCPEGLPAVVFGGSGAEGFEEFRDPGPFEAVRPAEEEIAMFLYTSGSTGRPKGVPLTHAGQLWAIRTRAANGGRDRAARSTAGWAKGPRIRAA